MDLIGSLLNHSVTAVSAPTVTISYPQATIIGSSALEVESFKGIPYAQPPVGSLRLKPPQPLESPLGTITATGIPPSCPQVKFSINTNSFPADVLGEIMNTPLFQQVTNTQEDCLTLDVFRPAGTNSSSNLPVLYWMYGGGFDFGSTLQYDGSPFVRDSIHVGKPIVYVAVNYRVNGFGFLPGKEIKTDGSANLGLRDQRLGLQWVADNIREFGGDPNRVTLWGESAGSMSIIDQMILYDGDHTYKGKPLFHSGIMDSGSIVPAHPIDGSTGQAVYDSVVSNAGCSSAPNTLECLRSIDYETLLDAITELPSVYGYHSLAFVFAPRPDGTVLIDSPELMVQQGRYAQIPIIVGDQEDEGTFFACFEPNTTTTEDIVHYISSIFYPQASLSTIEGLVATYPDDPAAGSPFRTGLLNNWYPQFKRLAAILGDVTFTLRRRIYLETVASVTPNMPTWSYLASYFHGTPILGTFHTGDILQVLWATLPDYASQAIHAYYYSFIYTQDPNNGSNQIEWPQWNHGQQLMQFNFLDADLLLDDFRSESYNFIKEYNTELSL